MHVLPTELPDVKLLEPTRYSDARGWFAETFNSAAFEKAGLPAHFRQDNQSFSHHGVLRGLHYQLWQQQAKLVRVVSGAIWDVVVDVRQGSPNFGRWAGFELTSSQGTMLFIPEGFAHGFLTLSESAEVLYKVTELYAPQAERSIRWDDPTLAIGWPLGRIHSAPVVSEKDARGSLLSEAELPASSVVTASAAR